MIMAFYLVSMSLRGKEIADSNPAAADLTCSPSGWPINV
jgi:hypothetical protein